MRPGQRNPIPKCQPLTVQGVAAFRARHQKKLEEQARLLQEKSRAGLSKYTYSNQNIDNSNSRRSGQRNSVGARTPASPYPSDSSVQYAMYLNDAKNVFYEDRAEAIKLRSYQRFRPILNYLLLVLVLFWCVLYFIRPHKGFCPVNAECGVFVHCHHGYHLYNGECMVSTEVKEKASQVGMAITENLKQEYGSQDCSSTQQYRSVPSKSFGEIVEEYSISTTVTQDEIDSWLSDREHQQKYGFRYEGGVVAPTTKNYSVFCRFQLIVTTPNFYIYFSGALVVLLCLLFGVRVISENRRARKIYKYLKEQVHDSADKQIAISTKQIEAKFGAIYAIIWDQVDRLRVEDQMITYYEDERLHWKLI